MIYYKTLVEIPSLTQDSGELNLRSKRLDVYERILGLDNE